MSDEQYASDKFPSAYKDKFEEFQIELDELKAKQADEKLIELVELSRKITSDCALNVVLLAAEQNQCLSYLADLATRVTAQQQGAAERFDEIKQTMKYVPQLIIDITKVTVVSANVQLKVLNDMFKLITYKVDLMDLTLIDLMKGDDDERRQAFIRELLLELGKAAVGKIAFLEIPMIMFDAMRKAKEHWKNRRHNTIEYFKAYRGYNTACHDWIESSQKLQQQLSEFRQGQLQASTNA